MGRYLDSVFLMQYFTMFKTVEFPTSIANLASSLANVNRNALSLK